jgi:hypothetical protein
MLYLSEGKHIYIAEVHSRMVRIISFYSGGAEFKSWFSYPDRFSWFFTVPPGKWWNSM